MASSTPEEPRDTSSGAAVSQQPEASASAPITSSSESGASPPTDAAPKENPWEVNKPVERRTQALNEEMHDCLFCFWSWITCGGPGARLRQLYVNGKLSRCMDDWTRLKNCMVIKMDPEKDITLIPGPHQVWRIRTRKQAAEFWGEQYKHLREGAPPREPPSGVSGGVDPDSGTLASPREDRGSCGSGGGATAEQDAGRQQQQRRRRQEAAARLWGHLGGGASR